MADAGRASHWSGYRTLASAVDFSSDFLERPSSPRSPPARPFSPDIASPASQSWWSQSPATAASPSSAGSPAMSPSQFSSFASDCYIGSPKSPHLALDSSFQSNYTSFRASSPAPVIIPTSPRFMSMSFPLNRAVTGPVVPQTKYIAPFSSGCGPTVISFRFIGEEEGLPMKVLRSIRALDLPIEGRDVTPFDETVATTITLRIWWPGYKQWSRRMTMRKATGLISTVELAMAIAEVYSDWFQSAVWDTENPDPQLARWSIPSLGINANNLDLLRLEQVSQGSWQAEVRLRND